MNGSGLQKLLFIGFGFIWFFKKAKNSFLGFLNFFNKYFIR